MCKLLLIIGEVCNNKKIPLPSPLIPAALYKFSVKTLGVERKILIRSNSVLYPIYEGYIFFLTITERFPCGLPCFQNTIIFVK